MYKILFLISIASFLSAQSKQDYVWLYSNLNKNSYSYDFNRLGNSTDPMDTGGKVPFVLRGNNASICDKDGNLLFYTNGCHVANGDHEIIENGSDINYGDFIVQYRQDTCEHYPGIQDVLILSQPESNDEGYLIIHKRAELDKPELYRSLLYSFVDAEANDGKGEIKSKNVEILPEFDFLFANLSAITHQNNEDWWILQPDLEETIHSILLKEDGFHPVTTTRIPTNFIENSSASGTTKFSPDGTKYCFFNVYDNLHLYDFDRSDGSLSNHQYLEVANVPDDVPTLSGCEWSPDSRYLYLTTTMELWQLDTWADNLEDGLVLIDTWNGAQDPFATTFVLMALAPDCRIYMCSGSSTNTYHVINNPNGKGQDCDFVQQGIQLPFVSSRATMPNFPRFRVDEAEKCDSTISSVFGEDIYWRRDLTCYPNPVRDRLTVQLPEQRNGYLSVYDMEGRLMLSEEALSSTLTQQLSLGGLPSGTYSVEFFPKQNTDRRIWTSKVVKVD